MANLIKMEITLPLISIGTRDIFAVIMHKLDILNVPRLSELSLSIMLTKSQDVH